MNEKVNPHTFHIPVMGTSYTIDCPIKVAHYGISSVISIIDDTLVERMRQYHSSKNNLPFTAIEDGELDYRAKRITAYVNLVKEIVQENFEKLKKTAFEKGSEITKYFEMLPSTSKLKKEYNEMLKSGMEEIQALQERLRNNIKPGSIDVNIMTKVDGVNYDKAKEPLPIEYNDAHAALRGFANSNLESSVVFSAGLNPRLYSYIAQFEDFFPDKNGFLKKKIILKVSDYRSALIQGKFLAKKGLWVSEFRIESGLNCGGHAFATDGYLLGPILKEFKENRAQLIITLFELFAVGLKNSNREVPETAPSIAVTVQGGVGTASEHEFLLEHYAVDAVGWGSPFLLVPEVINIDEKTMNILSKADESQLYLSNISPLGVPFNSVKGNTADLEKDQRIADGKPGAPCLKKFLQFNSEFTPEPICVASKEYQKKKILELKSQELDDDTYNYAYNKIVDKTCLCVGLSNAACLKNDIKIFGKTGTVSVCPGPNIAYFSKIVALAEMVDHIYGRANIILRTNRPNFFVKELELYIDYLRTKIEESSDQISETQAKYFQTFNNNLNDGISYYKDLFSSLKTHFQDIKAEALESIHKIEAELEEMMLSLTGALAAR